MAAVCVRRASCVSRVARVHEIVVCQPGGCCCKVDGWPAVCISSMLMGGRLYLKDDFHTDDS